MSDKAKSPLLNPDVISAVMAKREKDAQVAAILAEEVEEYRKVLNRLFATRDGQYLLKKMIRYSGLFSFDNKFDASMIEQKGKQKMITEMIKPYLTKELFAQAISE